MRKVWRVAGITLAALSAVVVWLVASPAEAARPECGVASWYGPGFYGRRTASGAIYTGKKMTAAHKSLPFGTKVRVTYQGNGQSIVVTITDRGPYIRGRIIDLSSAAADRFGLKGRGIAKVCLHVL